MKIVFFDMEFANGKIPGSVYSFGYVRCNDRFRLVDPQTDILMNPECSWNDYVRKNILAYPMRLVEQASTFPAYYKRIRKLLCRADLVVGYAVGNDTTALRKDCERYGLKPPVFCCLDLERVCKKLPDHREARGLDGCVKAWCRTIPENRHRSDGDAYATMLLFQAICEQKQIKPKEFAKQFADCMIASVPPKIENDAQQEPRGDSARKQASSAHPTDAENPGTASPAAKNRRRRRRRSSQNRNPNAQKDAGQPSAATSGSSSSAQSSAAGSSSSARRRRRRRRARSVGPANAGTASPKRDSDAVIKEEKPE